MTEKNNKICMMAYFKTSDFNARVITHWTCIWRTQRMIFPRFAPADAIESAATKVSLSFKGLVNDWSPKDIFSKFNWNNIKQTKNFIQTASLFCSCPSTFLSALLRTRRERCVFLSFCELNCLVISEVCVQHRLPQWHLLNRSSSVVTWMNSRRQILMSCSHLSARRDKLNAVWSSIDSSLARFF